MKQEEIMKPISPDGEAFIGTMTFGKHQLNVYKYEIDPIKNILTIWAR